MTGGNLVCPSCHTHLSQPVRYCYRCGAWLPEGTANTALLPPPPASEGQAWPCPRCGYPSPRGVNFCANCGLRLNHAPLDHTELKQRQRHAKQQSLTADQRDMRSVRINGLVLVGGVAILALDAYFLATHPGINSAYLAPIAALLLIRLPFSWRNLTRVRARMRARQGAADDAQAPQAGPDRRPPSSPPGPPR